MKANTPVSIEFNYVRLDTGRFELSSEDLKCTSWYDAPLSGEDIMNSILPRIALHCLPQKVDVGILNLNRLDDIAANGGTISCIATPRAP